MTILTTLACIYEDPHSLTKSTEISRLVDFEVIIGVVGIVKP